MKGESLFLDLKIVHIVKSGFLFCHVLVHMLVVVTVWLIKTRRLSPSTSLSSLWFLLMPASLRCLLLASSCLGVRINCALFAPVFVLLELRVYRICVRINYTCV